MKQHQMRKCRQCRQWKSSAYALLFVVVAAFVGASVCLAEIKPLTPEEVKLLETRYDQLTPEQKKVRDEAARRRALIEEGGVMSVPGTPKGTIRFVNLQKRVQTNDLQRVLRAFSSTMMTYDVKVVNADCEASLKIKVVDDPEAPRLVVAPDDRWAAVNVARLAEGSPAPAFLAARTRKEMIRAFAFLTAGSQRGYELLGPVKTPADFDKIVEKGLPFDVQMRTKKYLAAMGVEPEEKTTYRQLVEAGYLILPKDEYQKAIWEKLKAEANTKPTNPIKVRYEGKNAADEKKP